MERKNNELELNDSYTVISSGVTIKGNIESTDSLSIAGVVEGNVTCDKEIELCENAQINGDIQSISISISGAEINGNVRVEDRFVLDRGSVIIGSLSANSARINGRIDGPVTVNGEVSIASTAVVIGDLVSSSLVVENGAQLKGSYTVYTEEKHGETIPSYETQSNYGYLNEAYYETDDIAVADEPEVIQEPLDDTAEEDYSGL